MLRPRPASTAARVRGRARGFTLIEVLIVVGILATLVGLALPAVQKVRAVSARLKCQNNLRVLGAACQTYQSAQGAYPRNTVRPRGSTAINGQPPGNLSHWNSGTYESWLREITPHIDQSQARVQDAIPLLGCPSDPRGPDYKVPAYGFTWYVGVYSNPAHEGNGIIVDDSKLKKPVRVAFTDVEDGTSNTILITERPPPADGQWGWWDSACCIQDTVSAVRGDTKNYSSGVFGKCPDPAPYQMGNVKDNCAFNAIWAFHTTGGHFCMGDGSVRVISFAAGTQSIGNTTLLEALASRSGREIVSVDY